ncbi:MAG: hypothetical protein IKP65_08830 [Alphaproteobacteria bacterium]|nr:hypothetical protein [Alphaproteobacteria bacterium]
MLDEKTYNKIVEKFKQKLGMDIDLDAEYEKIQRKESNLPRMKRDNIVTLIEYKRNYFSSSSAVEEEKN